MPGRGSYGPAGKWIHDRANRIMEKNPEIDKGVAYATATQQAHKVGKSPKKFRTKQGMREAKAKFSLPKKEYQKTAQAAFFDELEKVAGLNSAAAKILEAVFKTPARRFVMGVLLGSALYNGLPGKKKQQVRQAVTGGGNGGGGSQQPIVIMPPARMDAVQRELSKDDPEDTLGLGRLSKHFAPDLRELMEKKGMLQPPKPDTDLAAKRLKASQNIGLMGKRQPPKPNIRAVATKI